LNDILIQRVSITFCELHSNICCVSKKNYDGDERGAKAKMRNEV